MSDLFESGKNMGDELESLRATIEERHISADDANGAQPRSPHRRKRFLSYPRYVELMVTADAKMARHHGPNLEHYILTIMSVVSKIMILNFFKQSVNFTSSLRLLTHGDPKVADKVGLKGSVVCFCSAGVLSFRKVALFLPAQVTMATYAELITC